MSVKSKRSESEMEPWVDGGRKVRRRGISNEMFPSKFAAVDCDIQSSDYDTYGARVVLAAIPNCPKLGLMRSPTTL
eukprot:scaffold10632_cov73-Skeletonema_marinoi.AAC.1